jgi:hypothetical protein
MLKDFNPDTGLVTTIKVEDGEMRVNYSQDNEAIYERLQKLRNEPEFAKQGIKNNFQQVVHITDADCMKMIVEDGFDPYRESAKALRLHLRKNRSKYSHLFVTSGRI